MSSTWLNAVNITMVSRLLREAMLPGDSKNLRNKAARYLTHRFQDGMFDEGRLRMALKQFLKKQKSMDVAVDRWDDEGGAS
ncbi:hypothetical protein [Brucella pseudogrignonensis]|nr:hypothetical protein [Brucella pseudogrignonensis]